jgi:hypothetical protein
MDIIEDKVSASIANRQNRGETLYYNGKKIATRKDFEKAMQYAYKKMCESKGFVFTHIGENMNDYRCEHTEKTCKRDSTLHNEEKIETDNSMDHLEWRPNVKKCVLAYKPYVKLCNENKLTYDKDIGKCEPNKKYCECRGLKWKPHTKDCQYYPGQKETSYMFGKTMTQGFMMPGYCSELGKFSKIAGQALYGASPVGLAITASKVVTDGPEALKPPVMDM